MREFENSAPAAGDASERIVRDDDWQAGLFRDQFIDVAQQSTAAREYDAAFRDVAAQIRRRLLERLSHGAHDPLQRFLERLKNLI